MYGKEYVHTDISIIIVNFNTRDLLAACLRSIGNPPNAEVIVVDNGSGDGSVQMVQKQFPDVIVIQNKNNLGFARANNQGIRCAHGKYILLLNSDTEVRKDGVASMLQFLAKHPKAGAATCRLELVNGEMDPACHRGFPTPWASLTYLIGLERLFPRSRVFSQYHMGYENMETPHQVDCISGAFFLARKEAIDDVGLLDEDYFFYAEDIDWAYRFKKKGWEIWFNPEVSVLHKKKQSGRNHALRSRQITTQIYFHTYNWLFYKKHFAKIYGPIITLGVNTFYSLRLFLLKHFSL